VSPARVVSDPEGQEGREEVRPPPRVKICGLTHVEDVHHAAGAGADYLGFILTPGFGRSVPPEVAGRLVDAVATARVAVVVDEPPSAVARAAEAIEASVIQLHGSEGPDEVEVLRRAGPWQMWKAVRARSIEDVLRVVATYGDLVDGVLVEGWKRGVAGGGGVRLSVPAEQVRAAVRSPDRLTQGTFVLAGGLTADNVADAVARFAPDVVDVSSGVEHRPGRKDPDQVEAFLRAARGTADGPVPPTTERPAIEPERNED
jgi:phosphoribosylanthranilate isomerase